MSSQPWPQSEALERRLADAGFELCWPVAVTADLPGLAPEPGPARLGLLIGNNRSLWPLFLGALAEQTQLGLEEHPLDRWVEKRLVEVLQPSPDARSVAPVAEPDAPLEVAELGRCRLYFAHRKAYGQYPPLQRLVATSPEAGMSPCGLVVHPVYGPWLALRALLVTEYSLQNDLPRRAPPPCAGCLAPCQSPFTHALQESAKWPAASCVRELWREWLSVRDACPLGQAQRYTDNQIVYHYRRERAGWPDPPSPGLTRAC